MIHKKSLKNIAAMSLVMIMGVLLFISPLTAAAETNYKAKNVQKYDEQYYSRFKGKDIEINVYNWGEYISTGEDGMMDTNAEFEKLTGIKVNYSNYETNEGMYAKLKSGANSYDVIFPSDYMVSRLIQEKMIQPLNYDNIPNFKYIGKEFLNPEYDPENQYSVPYMWGRVCIIYNEKLIGHKISSINELWNPEYADKILMFKNSRDAFALALEKLGYSINTENKKELEQAAEVLKQQKPLVQAYVMDQIFDKMQGNEAAIAPYYIGDYYVMKKVNPDLKVYIPDNTNIYYDAVCIPSDANNKEAAEMYINFLNEPQVAADNAKFIMYSSPNTEAVKLLDDEIRNDKDLYPPVEDLKHTQAFVNLSEKTNLFVDQLWTDVLSQDDAYLDWVMPAFVVFSIVVILTNSIRKKRRREIGNGGEKK
ncbi:ABC transporter substrate-binding protein [Aminipila terrae]|uniref:Extracellular solute-binding protein n=1 Tax=Aminipila terrae TaxID=2697030 RepID=A0A6P1MG81_9FIRM|nr:spermidine/putrescine ABC transporter substrate-binding protein [Aminipila terrae]QHI71594.1 extracellular solute-binding protein [Aminipila terrae]